MMCWRNGVLVNWKNDDLFSDAELREDRSEDFVGGDGTGDGAQMMINKAELFGQKIGGAAVVEGGEGTDEGFVRTDEGFVVATVGDDGVAVILSLIHI